MVLINNNINYNDKGLLVQYLQYFLHDNYTSTIRMSGTYDEYTHKKLKEYLDMPNLTDYTELIPILQNIDSGLIGGDLQYPFKAMQVHGEENSIVFYMKNPKAIKGYTEENDTTGEYEKFKRLAPVLRTVYKPFNEVVESNGWRIAEYPSMYYNSNDIDEVVLSDLTSIAVVLRHKTPTNIFPHHDIRYMINYFNNDYINNVEVQSKYFHKSSKYRIALVNCQVGDTFVIGHGYSYSIPIKIGFSTEKIDDIKDVIYTSKNNASLKIYKITDNTISRLMPGTPTLITVPSDYEYKTMLIETPYLSYTQQINVDEQTPMSYIDTGLRLGDINNDGSIDEIDRLIFACQRPNEMGVGDGVFYFSTSYDRYKQLCQCVKDRYEKLFIANSQELQYNTTYSYNGEDLVGIDKLVNHLQFFCKGSNIQFQRSLINGEINYKITVNNYGQSIKNMTILNSNEYNTTVADFDLYMTDTSQDSILKYYIYDDSDSDIGYGLSKSTASNGVRIICKSTMSANNLLVIKTNPDDNIRDCSKILNGNYNNEDGTLILPVFDFPNNPWMVREEFIEAMLEYLVNPYSVQEDIAYIYYLSETEDNQLLRGKFGENKFIFTDELREYLKSVQISSNSPFALGYFNKTAYSEMFRSAYDTYVNTMKNILTVTL